ncbi:MAG: toll/interleukin-1 receptor domain-containing protein [Desulfomonilaceae bacterium]
MTTIEAIESVEKDETRRRQKKAERGVEELRQLWEQAIKLGGSEDVLLESIRQTVSGLLHREKRTSVVFLSYSQKDNSVVRAFSTGLQRQGIEVWFDETHLPAGASLIKEISKGLESADCLVFFISKNSTDSTWALHELNLIMARRIRSAGITIIPILLDDTRVPALLRDVKYIDLRDQDTERGVRELSRAIATHRLRRYS